MKYIKSMMFAIALIMAAPIFFTACQEDAPEINYTMNVSVVNDFTKVVQAINDGFLKNQQAVDSLTKVLDKMNTTQEHKLEAISDILNAVNTTLEAKLAAVEAALNAQTLSLEAKMELLIKAFNAQTLSLEAKLEALKTAINNLPDYSAKLDALAEAINALPNYEDKLAAIQSAIAAMPNYSAKFDALARAINALPNYGTQLTAIQKAIVAMPNYESQFKAIVDALGLLKKEIEKVGPAQSGMSAELAKATTAITNLIATVKTGNEDETKALEAIVKKLEELKEKIGTGKPSGSGNTGGVGEDPDDVYGNNIEFNKISFGDIIGLIDKMNSKNFEVTKGIILLRTSEGRFAKVDIGPARTGYHIASSNDKSRLAISYILYDANGKVKNKNSVHFEARFNKDGSPVAKREFEVDFDSGNKGGIGSDLHFTVNIRYEDSSLAWVIDGVKFKCLNNTKAVTYHKY